MSEIRNVVRREARLDAMCFFDEFAVALDPASTDWDGEAWALTVRKLGIEGEDVNALWPVYSAELVAATQYLADGHELLGEHNLTDVT